MSKAIPRKMTEEEMRVVILNLNNENAALRIAFNKSAGQLAALRTQLAEAVELVKLCRPGGNQNPDGLQNGLHEQVRKLGEVHGFGALMSAASFEWGKRHPGAEHTTGPCRATVEAFLAKQKGDG